MLVNFLTKLEETLSPIDIALAEAFQRLLPPMTDAEYLFWYIGTLSVIVASLILGDILHDRRKATESLQRSGSNVPQQPALRKACEASRSSHLRRFATKPELIEAKARARHSDLIQRAQLIGANGKRVSDLDIERDIAAHQVCYVCGSDALAANIPESISAWYIKDFGYCPA